MSIVAKNPYSKGNSDFDIQIENYSTIECLGKFEVIEEKELKTIIKQENVINFYGVRTWGLSDRKILYFFM